MPLPRESFALLALPRDIHVIAALGRIPVCFDFNTYCTHTMPLLASSSRATIVRRLRPQEDCTLSSYCRETGWTARICTYTIPDLQLSNAQLAILSMQGLVFLKTINTLVDISFCPVTRVEYNTTINHDGMMITDRKEPCSTALLSLDNEVGPLLRSSLEGTLTVAYRWGLKCFMEGRSCPDSNAAVPDNDSVSRQPHSIPAHNPPNSSRSSPSCSGLAIHPLHSRVPCTSA